jgi:hypothetical protein
MDAEHLRFALEDAIEADTLHQYSPEWLLPFFGFFRRSFAICADSPEIRAFSGAPDAPQRMPDAVALAYLGHPQSS